MKKIILLLVFFISTLTNAQKIEGQWMTFDDKTYEKKGLVEIYKHKKKYYGRIIGSFTNTPDKKCTKCKGDKKDKPMIGMVIIEDLKKDGDEYTDGTILDPNNGKVYDCTIKLVGKNKLKVKGYIGISILGRAQYWKRVE